jgi:LmbE family N-acetylglucosaminyl deacetylase
VKRLMVLVPHPDDEILSMWPYIHYLASGYDVHLIFLTRGEVTAASLRLDGGSTTAACIWADHGYKHDPAREQYPIPTVEQIGLARLAEGMSAAGAMARIAPTVPDDHGAVFTHDENLGTAYGSNGAGSSTAPVHPDGVAKVDEIIRRYMDLYPNSLWWSMSSTDKHPDHAASGIALRNLKGTPVYNNPGFTFTGGDPVLSGLLTNAMFFASKLYWGPPRDPALAAEYESWYPNVYPATTGDIARREEYTGWIKSKVLKCYTAWNPAAGSFAIGGGHSTPGQFANCFGSAITKASALWHP